MGTHGNNFSEDLTFYNSASVMFLRRSLTADTKEFAQYNVRSGTGQMSKREKKVVVLVELHGASIYTTKMSKQVTKSHVGDAVHMYTCELKCRADI
jgi:hypothetical protein